MNYDDTDIASAYDRGRDHGPDVLALWMDAVSAHVGARAVGTILDLGCGTGRFSDGLAAHFRADVVGVDPSEKMLEQARRKLPRGRVQYVRAAGEAIPLADGSVDVVFMSMVFHHFTEPALVARECRRVLRAGAAVFVRTGTCERIESYPYVDFFPPSRRVLAQRLPAAAHVRGVFEGAGFRASASDVIVQRIAPSFASYADKVATRADSILAGLSDAEFTAGLAALRSHAAATGVRAVDEPIDVFVFRSPGA